MNGMEMSQRNVRIALGTNRSEKESFFRALIEGFGAEWLNFIESIIFPQLKNSENKRQVGSNRGSEMAIELFPVTTTFSAHLKALEFHNFNIAYLNRFSVPGD